MVKRVAPAIEARKKVGAEIGLKQGMAERKAKG
jgi:hypothetical protein